MDFATRCALIVSRQLEIVQLNRDYHKACEAEDYDYAGDCYRLHEDLQRELNCLLQGRDLCAFEEEAVKELLGVPDGVKVVALMPVGYPKLARLIRPVKESQRKGADEIFTTDSY